MVHQLSKIVIALALVVSFGSESFAQSAAPGSDSSTSKPTASGPRKQLATILFMGLGGAILGLSTLSFYGRPQDKLSNIAYGFAFGVIVGTSVVTYRAATNPQEMYGLEPLKQHDEAGRRLTSVDKPTPFRAAWAFEF